MDTASATTPVSTKKQSALIYRRIAVAWILIFIALTLAGYIGDYIEDQEVTSKRVRYLVQAIIMSGIVIPGIWYLSRGYSQNLKQAIGWISLTRAVKWMILGILIFFFPLVFTLLCTEIFGWGNAVIHASTTQLQTIFFGVLTVFLFEALPEELAFRGFIYSHLNSIHSKWKAGLITVVLFVLLPIILVLFQSAFLDMEVRVGGQGSLSLSYILTMFFFGSFVQYLRILSGSIWLGIGFHLAFVYLDRLIGTTEKHFVQLTDIQNEAASQMVLAGMLILIFIGLLFYPKVSGKSLQWNQKLE